MPLKAIANPSELFFAIGDSIIAAGFGVDVGNYDDFDGTVRDATVLIEFEASAPATRRNDGRFAHDYRITLHGVVAKWRKHAVLEAMNLSALLERLVDVNNWGISGQQCDPPRDVRSAPSMFQKGAEGYEAWGVTFSQCIYLGESLLEEDPVTVAGPFVARAWEVDINDASQYQPLG